MPSRKTDPGRVPTFRSADEEARFWDEHSPLDFPDDWSESHSAKTTHSLSHTLAVRLDAATLDTLAAIARTKGIGPSTLARMWLLEQLREEQHQAGEPARVHA